jgi:hypothetical protein
MGRFPSQEGVDQLMVTVDDETDNATFKGADGGAVTAALKKGWSA